MAKVMVSLPDNLLGSLDAEAARQRTTRSGLLRHYVDEGLRDRGQARARRVEQLMDTPGRHGGKGVDDLKRHRPPV
ncbi:MAG: ribbon-helix-helix protein, CopG family [Thermoleophilaceae bacterium]